MPRLRNVDTRGKIFVYQSAVLVVGYSYGYFDGQDMLRIGGSLTIVESIIMLLLVPLYWPGDRVGEENL